MAIWRPMPRDAPTTRATCFGEDIIDGFMVGRRFFEVLVDVN